MDLMREVIADIEERDHKVFTLEPGEELAEEIWELMEAEITNSPARLRATRAPASGISISCAE
jgi:hypothetical protein